MVFVREILEMRGYSWVPVTHLNSHNNAGQKNKQNFDVEQELGTVSKNITRAIVDKFENDFR